MNEILQKRIEEAAEEYAKQFEQVGYDDDQIDTIEESVVYGSTFALQNQWISVEEALPEENRIIAKLSKSFCNNDNCYEILCRIAKEHVDLKHPDGYYDLCGENVPTSAITHWMVIPSLEGGGK